MDNTPAILMLIEKAIPNVKSRIVDVFTLGKSLMKAKAPKVLRMKPNAKGISLLLFNEWPRNLGDMKRNIMAKIAALYPQYFFAKSPVISIINQPNNALKKCLISITFSTLNSFSNTNIELSKDCPLNCIGSLPVFSNADLSSPLLA